MAFHRAEALVELRRPGEAVDLLRATIAVHPGRADLWGQLAMALLAGERWQEAWDAAATRIQLAPQDEWGFRLASLALSGLDRRPEAAKAAAESVRLAPDEWRTHARLARALADNDRPVDAWSAAERAVELAPGEAEAHMALGAVAIALKGWTIAEQAFRRALALDPGNAAARNNLALVELHRGRMTGAASGFADAVATDPQVDVARRNLEVTLRVGLGRLLYCQALIAFVGRLYLGDPGTARPAGVVVGAGVAALLGVAMLRWQGFPAPVRRFAVSLLRGQRLYQAQVLLAGLGLVTLLLAVVLAAAGADGPVKAVALVALLTTAVARLLSFRRRPRRR